LPVPVPRRAGKPQHHNIGTKPAYYPSNIGKNPFSTPLSKCFFRRFRIAEVYGARKELLSAVDSASGQKLVRPDQTQQVALLRPDQVLAAFSPRERQVAGSHVPAARVVRQYRGVFVVRMSGDEQNTAEHGELLERLLDCRSSGKGSLRKRGGEKGKTKKQRTELGEMSAHPR